jgi:HEAT repeat protein
MNKPFTKREIAALVDHYLLEWDSRGWASAYHSLIELGPETLPVLERRFAESRNPVFRVAIVELARHFHSADSLPLFAAALRDAAPDVWKGALDGLVDLASPESIALLQEALNQDPPGHTPSTEWVSWLAEALEQARLELAARGGVA